MKNQKFHLIVRNSTFNFLVQIESNNPVQVALIHHTQFQFIGEPSKEDPNVVGFNFFNHF
jgi:hypothetical protein